METRVLNKLEETRDQWQAWKNLKPVPSAGKITTSAKRGKTVSSGKRGKTYNQ